MTAAPRKFRTITSHRLGPLSAADLELLCAALRRYGVDRIRFTPASLVAVAGLDEGRFEAFRHAIVPILRPLPGNGIGPLFTCGDSGDCPHGLIDNGPLLAGLVELDLPQPLPARIKVAVAGCARGCTMPRLRDVGIIPASARAGTYHLSFGGNGGRKPRIGDLIGTDLSTRQCLDLIHRALSVYQREAKTGMRTSAYLEATSVEIFLEKLKKS